MKTIEEEVENYYDDQLPYHNLDNILDILESAMELVWLCFNNGIEINAQVVYYSILFYGTGWQKKYDPKQYESRRHYSAKITKNVLAKYKLDSEMIKMIINIITRSEPELKTNEGKVVLIAEISSLVEDYKNFLDINIHKKVELEILRSEKINWSNYKKIMKNEYSFYKNKNLNLSNINSFDNLLRDLQTNTEKLLSEKEGVINKRESVLFPKK